MPPQEKKTKNPSDYFYKDTITFVQISIASMYLEYYWLESTSLQNEICQRAESNHGPRICFTEAAWIGVGGANNETKAHQGNVTNQVTIFDKESH